MTDCCTKQNQTPLSEDATRRILLSLIADEQEKLIKKGAVSTDRALAAQSLGLTKAQIGQMAIDEDQLSGRPCGQYRDVGMVRRPAARSK